MIPLILRKFLLLLRTRSRDHRAVWATYGQSTDGSHLGSRDADIYSAAHKRRLYPSHSSMETSLYSSHTELVAEVSSNLSSIATFKMVF